MDRQMRLHVYAGYAGFALSGCAIALWAAIVPYVQAELDLNHLEVGQLLMCMAAGSAAGMISAGLLTSLIGTRLTYTLASIICIITAIVLSLILSMSIEMVTLVAFGIGAACLEVCVSIYGAYLERTFNIYIMSTLYACYSLGEVAGALLMLAMLSLGCSPFIAITSIVALFAVIITYFIPKVLNMQKSGAGRKKSAFMVPRGPVILLALTVMFTYIVGGASLDWGGLYITQVGGIDKSYAAFGYMMVAFWMMICRFYGSYLIRHLGQLTVILGGAVLIALGLTLMVYSPTFIMIFIGFSLIGIGMSNITPLCMSAIAKQNVMPLLPAVSSVSVIGYGGLLIAPAALGTLAELISLRGTFIFLILMPLASIVLIMKLRPLFTNRQHDLHTDLDQDSSALKEGK